MKYTVKYSDDNGKTIKESEHYSNGCAAVDHAFILKAEGCVIYGIFKNGQQI